MLVDEKQQSPGSSFCYRSLIASIAPLQKNLYRSFKTDIFRCHNKATTVLCQQQKLQDISFAEWHPL